MGRRTYSSCTYDYTVKIKLTDIVDEIISRLPGEENVWEVADETLVIYMSDTSRAEEWHCNATLESPEEYELELQDSVEDVNVEKVIIEALHSIETVENDCEIDYDSIEIEETEPDPDRAYDEWKDRQFEDN